MLDNLTFIGGLLLGLASSPHCALMCGPIASSYILGVAKGKTAAEQAKLLLIAQLGKSVSYVAAGVAVGVLGSQAYSFMDRDVAFRILQYLSAMTLIAIGFSMTGIVPLMAGIARLSMPVSIGLHKVASFGAARTASFGKWGGALTAGMLWGFVPCGMVYAALFSAMFTGHAVNAASVMFGFALGVVPSVTASAMGAAFLPRLIRSDTTKVVIGLMVVGLGFVTIMFDGPDSALWCAPPR